MRTFFIGFIEAFIVCAPVNIDVLVGGPAGVSIPKSNLSFPGDIGVTQTQQGLNEGDACVMKNDCDPVDQEYVILLREQNGEV